PLGNVEGDEQHVHHQHPGQHALQVGLPVAGDGATEHEREQQHEHDRLDAEVAQLPRVVPDLDDGAPRQGQALPQAVPQRHPRGGPGRRRGHVGHGGHLTPPSVPSVSTVASAVPVSRTSSAGRPVSDRNTSLRLELRSASSATTTPASSSRRTTVDSTDGSPTCALTTAPATSGRPPTSSPTTDATSPTWVSSTGWTTSVRPPTLVLSSCGVPVAITRPWSITTISSASSSASSR